MSDIPEQLREQLRDPRLIQELLRHIRSIGERLDAPLHIMEICGGHTEAIVRAGIDELLPDSIRLIHGPGCPVCILPSGRIDQALHLAQRPGTSLAVLADSLRVPGSDGRSLQQARARGASVETLYDPLTLIPLAARNPEREFIYFAIGFETTTPATALLLQHIEQQGIDNIRIHSNHVLVPPPVDALLKTGSAINALIGPGHACTISGTQAYSAIAEQHATPVVVAGFEPADILDAIRRILQQRIAGIAELDIQYRQLVRPEGNRRALNLIERYFETRDDFDWKGMGTIPGSALRLRPAYAHYDAEVVYANELPSAADQPFTGCRCSDILRGTAQPQDCPLFANGCTPERPQGSCMVSGEGACSAYYRFRGPYA